MDRVQIAVMLLTVGGLRHCKSDIIYAFEQADLILRIAAETEPKQPLITQEQIDEINSTVSKLIKPPQQRTVAKVMREALGNEVYEKWLLNMPNIYLDKVADMKASTILGIFSFDWNYSNEGNEFWTNVHEKLLDEGK